MFFCGRRYIKVNMVKFKKDLACVAAAFFILFTVASSAGATLPRSEIIPAGEVTLGSDDEERAYGYSIGGAAAMRWRWCDVELQRTVHVGEFKIDLWPVTQGEYLVFVIATGHRRPHISEAGYEEQGFLVHPYKEVKPYLWRKADKDEVAAHVKTVDGYLPPIDKLDHPVVLVSVADGEAYCRWRGEGASLPTENQWEKAARGADGRYFPWGDAWDDSKANIWQSGPHGTTPVSKYPDGRSPYGISDMAGNVFEWTATPFGASKESNVLKSCSWDDRPGICRAAARHGRPKWSRHILIGFRCAASVR